MILKKNIARVILKRHYTTLYGVVPLKNLASKGSLHATLIHEKPNIFQIESNDSKS